MFSSNYTSLSAYLTTYNRLSLVQTFSRTPNSNRAAQFAQTVSDLLTKAHGTASTSAGKTGTSTTAINAATITAKDVTAAGKALASAIGSIINIYA